VRPATPQEDYGDFVAASFQCWNEPRAISKKSKSSRKRSKRRAKQRHLKEMAASARESYNARSNGLSTAPSYSLQIEHGATAPSNGLAAGGGAANGGAANGGAAIGDAANGGAADAVAANDDLTNDIGFNDAFDFDVGDQSHIDFRTQNQEIAAQIKEIEENQWEHYADLVIDKKSGFQWNYEYTEGGSREWKKFEEKELKDDEPIHTATTLTLSGIDALQPLKDNDERIKNVMVKELRFSSEQIEKIIAIKDRFWCKVTVRAPLKVIRDRQRWAKRQNAKKRKERRVNFRSLSAKEKEQYPPLYSIRDFDRRLSRKQMEMDLAEGNDNNKLFVMNFDILSKTTHRGLTKMFLRFGDLRSDIFIGLNWEGNPFAIVEFTESAVARTLYSYQNKTGHPDQKIKFGGRTLSIQFSNPK